MIKPADIFTKSDKAVSRTVDQQEVVVQPSDGMVNVINETGSRIWALIDSHLSIQQIADLIAEEYDTPADTALNDTVEFIESLLNNGMIQCQTPQ